MDENERKWFSFISGHFGPFSIILLHLLKEGQNSSESARIPNSSKFIESEKL